jgi:hypothetical protein
VARRKNRWDWFTSLRLLEARALACDISSLAVETTFGAALLRPPSSSSGGCWQE